MQWYFVTFLEHKGSSQDMGHLDRGAYSLVMSLCDLALASQLFFSPKEKDKEHWSVTKTYLNEDSSDFWQER